MAPNASTRISYRGARSSSAIVGGRSVVIADVVPATSSSARKSVRRLMLTLMISPRLESRVMRRILLLLLIVLVAYAAYEWATFPDVDALKSGFPQTTSFMEI